MRAVWRSRETVYQALLVILLMTLGWTIFIASAHLLKLERLGFEVHPLYALYKSTGLNSFIEYLARLSPRLWRVLGNMGVAASVGEIIFMSYLLFINLYRFFYIPERASPVMPLIPGVTIRAESLPWFLAAAGVVILLHELSHGIQCVVEGIPIRSSAILLAVVTFGGAVEPDEEKLEKASRTSKMRIFASGSMANLATGIILVAFFILFGDALPDAVYVFLQWVYFLSINIALVNMLPIHPLDGGRIFKAFISAWSGRGRMIERATMYSFIALVASNLILSLIRFGLIPL